MENWYKVTLPYGKGAALANQLQLAFEIIWEAHGSPREAALFTNHDSRHDYEFIYLSPAAATIAESIILESLRELRVYLRNGLGRYYWLGTQMLANLFCHKDRIAIEYARIGSKPLYFPSGVDFVLAALRFHAK